MYQSEIEKKLAERQQYGFPSNKTVVDADGNKLTLAELDGKIVPPFGEKYFRQIRDLEVRDDDVFLCGYPKTGCHWTWEILKMIRAKDVTYTKFGKGESFLELRPSEVTDSQPSPRVLNTHVWYDYLPKQLHEKKTKIIFTSRNPKDTAASFYNHHVALGHMYGDYKGTFKAWFPLYMEGNVQYGGFADYHLSWYTAMRENPGHPIYITSFENKKEDLPREIRNMAKFLEVDLSDDLVLEIAKQAGFDSMKKEYTKDPKNISGKLLRKVVLRKGQVGDWKNWLTVAQSDQVDEEIDKKLAHTSFKFRYTI